MTNRYERDDFPYRRYTLGKVRRRKQWYRWRMNHDAWAVVMVLAMIAVFVILEMVR